MRLSHFFISVILIIMISCRDDDDQPKHNGTENNEPTPYTLNYPPHFGYLISPLIPEDNPLTVEGIFLGKKLFFEKQLSKDNSISCANCHRPEKAFNDEGNPVSFGVGGAVGVRNAMPLFNLAWGSVTSRRFNWHGNSPSLEEQAFEPVTSSFEMQERWPNVVSKLQNDPSYPPLFKAAFETEIIDSSLVVKAIAQYERTLISSDSRVDKHVLKTIVGEDLPKDKYLTDQELRGFDLFMEEGKGDCFHCHGNFYNPLWTNNEFINNGLDLSPDSGLAIATKKPLDLGKFKTPSLRNLVFTSPYMHDGRFETIREVIDFYADDVETASPNLDPNMKNRSLNNQEREDLEAFLKALTDSSFVNNEKFLP